MTRSARPDEAPPESAAHFTVLFDGRVIAEARTGIGRYALGLVGGFVSARVPLHLRVLIPADLEPSHAIFHVAQAAVPPTRITLERIGVPAVSLRQQLHMPAILRSLRHDLYHYPHFDLPWGARGPSIVTVHDLKYVRYPELLRNRSRSFYVRWTMTRSVRRAQAIITDSDATRGDLITILGAPPERTHAIHLASGLEVAASPIALSPAERRARVARLGLAPGYFLFVGERRPHKNLVTLLKAYARLRAQNTAAPPLVIAGLAYADYRAPEEAIDALGLGASVRLLDGVSDHDLAALYAEARALLLPSLYEGFGLPIVEAMAAGTPVITSNRSSMPEVAGDAAILIDPGDAEGMSAAMARFLADEELARDLSARGRRRARDFSWEATARATFAVYAATLEAAGIETHHDRAASAPPLAPPVLSR